MYGATTPTGSSPTRSTTAIIINTKWFFNWRDVQYGQYGELTTLVADLQIDNNMCPIRLTSVYGDSDKKKEWNKTIAKHLKLRREEPHMVGGDFNHHSLCHNVCHDDMSKAVAYYTDSQQLFRNESLLHKLTTSQWFRRAQVAPKTSVQRGEAFFCGV